mgnify:CR=1 FL=1
MTIIGIGNSTNSHVTILQDGKITYAAQEERFTRKKQIKTFPTKAISDGLRYCSLTYTDIDYVVCGGWQSPDQDTLEDYFQTVKKGYSDKIAAEKMFWSMKKDFEYRDDFYQNALRMFPQSQIKIYEHHYCHACTAFYTSKFNNSYILTSDGRGDSQSIVIWKADRENGIQKIKSFSELKSVGSLYGQITGVLGFTPDKHEGKITGLAAFGKYSIFVDFLTELIHYEDGNISISKDYIPFLGHKYNHIKEFVDHNNISKEDIAFAVQFLLEDIIIKLINNYVPQGANLSLAGGTFANVKLNQRIREKCELSNYYIFPEMGDGGIGFGAAIAKAVDQGTNYFDWNETMLLGPIYSFSKINLDNYEVYSFKNVEECSIKAVELILQGKIAGIFTGRMEYGPRALGSRSIMFETKNKIVNETINKRLNRTEFMPFAPVTLLSEASKMYLDYQDDFNTSFMTTCYNCTETMQKISPAVVHVDNTARPQIISKNNSNKLYYTILKEYFNKTGIPNLVNTSFNNHEEPIVCNPENALESLEKNNIDCIVTDMMIIMKKK